MPQDQNNLAWIDMEMTGLNPDSDRIIEVAIIITDSALQTVIEAPVLVVHQSDAVLDAMDSWNKGTHGRSGLIEKVRASTRDVSEVEQLMLDFERVGEALASGACQGNDQARQARGAGRYPGIHRGIKILPRAFSSDGLAVYSINKLIYCC